MNASLNKNNTTVAQVKLLINGEWVDSKTKEWLDVVNPASQTVLAKVPMATQEEVKAAIGAAERAFHGWKKTPLGARMRIMLKLQALIRDNSKRIAEVLSAEQGKTIADAEGDIFRGLEVVEHACSIGSLQMGEFAENVAGGVDTYTHNTLQLPSHDPAVDVSYGDRHGQHLRAQAIGAGSALYHDAGRTGP
jgi:malonate-semialdehyde dehydrogenase (acetylating)/methylmalonate-semialdehyde dehydrogenase